MRYLPTILLVLSLPAGMVGYAVGVTIMSALPLPEQVREPLILFGPLFIGGLFMLPFLVPFFDRKAKQDLAAHQRTPETNAKVGARQGPAGRSGNSRKRR